MSRLSRGYYFLGIRKVVKDVVSLYNIYIRNKATYYTPYRLIKSLETLLRPWKLITLDFVVGLLLSRDLIIGLEYDLICVVTDRFTKYAYIVLVLGTINADIIAQLFLRTIFVNHGIPDEVILDKDKLFTSKF